MRHGVGTRRGKAIVWQEDFGQALQSKSLDGEAGQFIIMRGTGPDAAVSWVKADKSWEQEVNLLWKGKCYRYATMRYDVLLFSLT